MREKLEQIRAEKLYLPILTKTKTVPTFLQAKHFSSNANDNQIITKKLKAKGQMPLSIQYSTCFQTFLQKIKKQIYKDEQTRANKENKTHKKKIKLQKKKECEKNDLPKYDLNFYSPKAA